MKITNTAVAGLLSLLFVSASYAETVTLTVTATVTDAYQWGSNPLGTGVSPGDTVTGTYTFESSQPDYDPSPDYGYYSFYETNAWDLTLNEHAFQTSDYGSSHTMDLWDTTYTDRYSVSSTGFNPLANGAPVGYVDMILEEFTGTALTSDQISDRLPSLGVWDISKQLTIQGAEFSILAEITELVDTRGAPNAQISPAAGLYIWDTLTTVAIILPDDTKTITSVSGTMNGIDASAGFQWACFPGDSYLTGRTNLVCPNFPYHFPVQSGINEFSVTLTLDDGSTMNADVEWNLLPGY